jgi:hypothetical protein
MERRIVDKPFTFTVSAEGEPVSKKFDLDKNVKFVRGILLSSNYPNLLFYRGSQRIEISGEEIFPENYESKILMSGLSVAPDEKFNGVIAGNGEVKILYKDTANSHAPFESYSVTIILQCEMK